MSGPEQINKIFSRNKNEANPAKERVPPPQRAINEAVCPVCDGSGWERTDDSPHTQVKRCRCYLEKYRKRLWERSGVPDRFRECRLDNFDVFKAMRSGKRMVDNDLSIPKEICINFANKYPAIEQGLLLMGPIGVGKTHLTVGIIAELTLNKGVPCLFYDFRELLKAIQRSYNVNSQVSELSILEPVLNCDVLVLDELGARKVTDWMLDMLTYIINRRYNERKTTIITSNWMDKPLREEEETLTDRVGYRIRSRLYEMCTEVQIRGKDYRMQKKSHFNFNF